MLRSKLRLKALSSLVLLAAAAAAFFAHGRLLSTSHPCIAVANTSVEIAELPWHADLHVAFTDDPAAATVRVQITDDADAADFAIADDNDAAEVSACEGNPATRGVWILDAAARGAPVIYLAHDGPADYRIFVRSKSFTQRDAAALVVGARLAGRPQQAASL